MKLIVGLGNPGKKYANNRHNAGFRCIELLADKNAIQIKRGQCQSKVGGGTVAGVDVVIARPHTFVNSSGMAVKGLMQKYRIQIEDLIVICDDLDLPAGWDEYLGMLKSKQRHEVRRKLRRLAEAGQVSYRFITDGADIPGAMDTFLRMFTESRDDKAVFMTGRMESFFRSVADSLAEAGIFKLGVLELDSVPASTIICFDYKNSMYLYNSGYDPVYNSLSVGLLSKVLCIKDSIEAKKEKFDFLKGDEEYKYHLGGSKMPIYNCRIEIK